MNRIRRIFHPEIFQGTNKKNQYFEGWYFKNVSSDGSNIIALIPGIALGKSDSDQHSFIQFFNGVEGIYHYFKFPFDYFSADLDEFKIKIGNNIFSSNGLTIDINQDEFKIHGKLDFHNLVKLPKKPLSPNIMGWFSFIPFMEAKHCIVSMNHSISGNLNINRQIHDFSGGKGYIEKDYGRSFPSSYIWMHSNHFKNPETSFMMSVATIPWLGHSFNGFLSALQYDSKLYQFATYNRSKINPVDKTDNSVEINLENKYFLLKIKGNRQDHSSAVSMKSPSKGLMTSRIFESLTSTIELSFFKKSKSGLLEIFTDIGQNAGLEIMDEKNEIFK